MNQTEEAISQCVKCGKNVWVSVLRGTKTMLHDVTFSGGREADHHCSSYSRQEFEKRRIAIKSREVIEEAKLWHYAQPPGKYFATYAAGFNGHYDLNEGNTKPLEIRCPECNQPAGERCRNKGIKSRVTLNSNVHMSRIRVWLKARGLTFDNGDIVPKWRIPTKQRP